MKEKDIQKIFGEFKYVNSGKGAITILDNWATDNIVKVRLNKTTLLYCHYLIETSIRGIYQDLKRFGLEAEFDLRNGGGCHVPRHICWNPKKRLSFHSWAIAIDINPKKFPYGSNKRPSAALIFVFEKHGFEWGGGWRSKDMMHFQHKGVFK